ncbi:MAG: hypothetical protein ACOCG5_11725 [Candidatus Alkaliphilus sp. MAG34]
MFFVKIYVDFLWYLSEAKDLKWPKNGILRYTQNDKKREGCFFTQPDVPLCHPIY